MKFLKNNLKVIIAFLLGTILTGGIVYAAVSASEISYTTNKNANIKYVSEALNDLYTRTNTSAGKTKVLLESNLNTSTSHSISASNIANYKNLTANDFIVEAVSLSEYHGDLRAGRSNKSDIEKTYDAATRST